MTKTAIVVPQHLPQPQKSYLRQVAVALGLVGIASLLVWGAMDVTSRVGKMVAAEKANAVASPDAPTQQDRDRAKEAWVERAAKRQEWVATNRLTNVPTTTKRSEKNGALEHVVSLDHPQAVWSVRFVLDVGAEGALTVEVSPDRKVWEKVEIKDGDQLKWGGMNTKEVYLPSPCKVAAIRFRVEHPDVPVDLKYSEILVQKF